MTEVLATPLVPLQDPPRELLRRQARHLEGLTLPMLVPVVPEATDPRRAQYRELETGVLELMEWLPAGVEDYEARLVLQFLTELRQAIENDEDGQDPGGRVELAGARLLDVLRRIQRRVQHRSLDDPAAAVRFTFDTLADVPVSDVARLLGVSTKTVAAWREGKPVRSKADRVVALARVLAYLRDSMTPRGLVLWFGSEQDALNGSTPLAVLDEGSEAEVLALTSLARGGRGQLAD